MTNPRTEPGYAMTTMTALALVMLVGAGVMPATPVLAQSVPAADNADEPLRLRTRSARDTTTDRQGEETAEDAGTDDQSFPADQAESLNEQDTRAAADAAALQELDRQNPREESLDGLRPKQVEDDTLTPGIPVGTFTFRPTISASAGFERTRTGKDTTSRSFLQSGFKGSLVSNWALHELRIDAEGTWQKTLSGIPGDDPEGRIDATLKLDLSDSTIATLKSGYSLQRESVSAANAIANATQQAEVSTYTASAEATHDLGLIRGTAGIDFSRETYGPAQLENGKFVSQEDRNSNTATLRGRIGYELSPALIPFLEASYGQTIYDKTRDTLGYVRDAELYAVKAGLETDFGEKLRGELAAGYAVADFEDARLRTISAMTIDGKATWSPRRGTDVEFGLRTEIEPSTTAGASGDVAYTASAALTQSILERLSGRISAFTTIRDYSLASVPNQTVYNLGTGLTWGLSRSIDLTTDLSWERSIQSRAPTSHTFTAGVGVSLKR